MTRVLIAGRLAILVLFAAAVVTAAVVLAGCSSSSGSTTVTSHNPGAQQIARGGGLTGFRDCGGSEMFVTDSGIGYKGNIKYGVDTFATTQARDAWLQLSKSFGGFPSTYQQGDTWVLYRAEDQSPGC